MKVAGVEYRTVWMDGHSVFFIDQNLLPFHFTIRKSTSYKESCDAIKTMQVRGAGAIGALAGFAMAQAAFEAPALYYQQFLGKAKHDIESTRPTARNLFHATDIVYHSALISPESARESAWYLADKDAADSFSIGEFGNELILDGMRIETHCNAGWLAFVDYGTALSPIYRAFQSGKSLFVYADETRPRNQGSRLTAWELNQANIPHAIIPDNAGAWLMSLGKIDMVITGADRIASNGDTANKIGTLEKAIAAREFGIPFYIAAPCSTFDIKCRSGAEIQIEERDMEEVLFMEGLNTTGETERIRVSSPGSGAINPAFDVTPAKYITGIITEKGIINPEFKSIEKLFKP